MDVTAALGEARSILASLQTAVDARDVDALAMLFDDRAVAAARAT
jgi:hypothetical protein